MEINEKDIREMVESIAEIRTALSGYNGQHGLIQSLSEHVHNFEKHCEDDAKFRRSIYIVLGALISSGALGIGIIQFT